MNLGRAWTPSAGLVPLPARPLPLGRPAGIMSLPGPLPSPLPNATVFTATSNGGGTWQNPGIWTIPQPGGQRFPNNSGGDTYNVTVTGNPTYQLDASVTLSSLEVTSGMTFQNTANRFFTVEGDFNSLSGTLTSLSAVTLVMQGNTTFNSRLDLRNGAGLINSGNLSVGALAASFHDADPASPSSTSDSMINTGRIVVDRPGQSTTFQNWSFLNQGTIDLRQGNMNAQRFTQTNAGAIFRVKAGATLQANGIEFNGGTVIASGSSINASSFSFRNSTLHIGESIADIGNLTLGGNATGDAGQGATFRFLFAGAGAGQFDTLTIQNGMNFNGLTLDIDTLDGFEPAETDVFRIITGNNLGNGNFANVTGGVLDVPDLGTFDITRNNTFVELSGFIPIPEPSSAALLAAGAVALRLRRRGRA